MVIKKLHLVGLLIFYLCTTTTVQAAGPFGQTVEINTNLRAIIGTPSWLVIVRNMETGEIIPYVFDFTNDSNFWLVLTYSRFYRITVSQLKFNNAISISNFCHLEDGILSQESMFVTLTGVLSPDPRSSRCFISRFKPYEFPVVEQHSDNPTKAAPAETGENPLEKLLPQQ
jgi:hypothetical protein